MTGRRLTSRPSLRTVLVAVLAVASIVTGTIAGSHAGSASSPSARARIAADPPPTLFPEDAITPTATMIDAARKDADRQILTWVAAHGTRPDDTAFLTWLEHTFPAPPADLSSQMPQVVSLSKTRTAEGVKAATWLETYGKKDVWKVYTHDQREFLTPARGKALKKDEKALLKMAKTAADSLGAKYESSAPYVRQPSLRPDHKVAPGQKCPCSYPSRHASAAAAAETLLGHLQPHLDPQYRYLEAEVDYSRIYMAGHFPGDITAGALLGDLIGDYFLITREGADPAALLSDQAGTS